MTWKSIGSVYTLRATSAPSLVLIEWRSQKILTGQYLVYRLTDRRTDRPTVAKQYAPFFKGGGGYKKNKFDFLQNQRYRNEAQTAGYSWRYERHMDISSNIFLFTDIKWNCRYLSRIFNKSIKFLSIYWTFIFENNSNWRFLVPLWFDYICKLSFFYLFSSFTILRIFSPWSVWTFFSYFLKQPPFKSKYFT